MLAILEKLPLKGYFKTSWILNLLIILLGLFVQKLLPPQIPVYYGFPQGEAQLSPPIGIIIPPILSLAFILINLFLISVIKDEFIKKTLVLAGLATAIFAGVTAVKIFFLVSQI
jgi:hypothetical protein